MLLALRFKEYLVVNLENNQRIFNKRFKQTFENFRKESTSVSYRYFYERFE